MCHDSTSLTRQLVRQKWGLEYLVLRDKTGFLSWLEDCLSWPWSPLSYWYCRTSVFMQECSTWSFMAATATMGLFQQMSALHSAPGIYQEWVTWPKIYGIQLPWLATVHFVALCCNMCNFWWRRQTRVMQVWELEVIWKFFSSGTRRDATLHVYFLTVFLGGRGCGEFP